MEPNLASLRLELLAQELEKPDAERPGPLSLRALAGRDTNGRFAAALTVHELLDAVLDVASAAAPDPQAASTRSWDRARTAAGRPELPTASTICRRLGLPWPTVLALALTEPAERSRSLGLLRKPQEFRGDDETVLASLRLVARRLNAPLGRLAYDIERLKVDTERVRRGRPPLNLPHSETVERRLRSWVRACELAGVEPASPVAPPLHRAKPAVELLDEFISETGLLPYRNWFERWCRGQDIPLGRDARRWDELVRAVRKLRRARGEKTPTKPASSLSLPSIPATDEGRSRSRRRPKRRTHAEVLASLRRYKECHLESGQQPRQKHYLVAAKKDDQLLAISTLVRHGRFQDLCREAGI